jgi:hypothetical protein
VLEPATTCWRTRPPHRCAGLVCSVPDAGSIRGARLDPPSPGEPPAPDPARRGTLFLLGDLVGGQHRELRRGVAWDAPTGVVAPGDCFGGGGGESSKPATGCPRTCPDGSTSVPHISCASGGGVARNRGSNAGGFQAVDWEHASSPARESCVARSPSQHRTMLQSRAALEARASMGVQLAVPLPCGARRPVICPARAAGSSCGHRRDADLEPLGL